VHGVLGYGFLEKVCEKSLLAELRKPGLKADTQRTIKVKYKDVIVGDYVADVAVEDNVIVELRTEETYSKVHEAQLLSYLNATGIKVGLLINFGRKKCEFRRLVT
jgi:GxxExxY protein